MLEPNTTKAGARTHTAGPWHAQGLAIYAKGNVEIAQGINENTDECWHMLKPISEMPYAEARANAFLMAAAPDLLNALRRIADGQWPDSIAETAGTFAMREVARAAIAAV